MLLFSSDTLICLADEGVVLYRAFFTVMTKKGWWGMMPLC